LYQPAKAQRVLEDPINANVFVDPQLIGVSRTNQPAFGLDPRPKTGSPALSSPMTALDDGFYTPVAYRGAFANVNWASDWTFAGECGLLSGAGAGLPNDSLLGGEIVAPTLEAGLNGSDLVIALKSQNGASYQLQSVATVAAGNWVDTGSPVSGTGGDIQFSQSIAAGGNRYFRIVVR